MSEHGQGSDRLTGEGLSEHPTDEGSRVTLARERVAADPHLLTGAEVRGEAEAGRVALGHESVSFELRSVYRQRRSVAVADVPDAPLSAVVVGISDLDRLQALGAGVLIPEGEVGASVAVVPDLVCLVDGHGSFRLN